MQLEYRSNEKEFLDNEVIESTDLFQTLKELDVINTYLGGYNASINGLKTILKFKPNIHTVLDVGFGGGDSIKQLNQISNKLNLTLFFYGVDLKSDCITYAEKNLAEMPNKVLICDDYRNISPELLEKIDILHCSLFLHHLADEEIVQLFTFAKKHGCIVLANDLHRTWPAFYSIKLLTALFSKSWLVKNDAAVSVARAFKKKELEALLRRAGFTNYIVKWNWAFRFSIIAFE